MFSTVAVVSLFASAALAQTATGAAASIPTGISSTCKQFLLGLDSQSALSTCASAITGATKAFASGKGSTSDVDSSLSNLCSASTQSACSASSIRTALAQFYQACTTELTPNSGNANIKTLYDEFYTFVPLSQALCVKDDNGAYCVKSVPSSASTKRDVTTPNTTDIGASNALFFYLTPTLDSSKLCTTCTREVLNSWAEWETDAPYGPGLSSSPTLYNQQPLYNGVVSTCGSNFLQGNVQAAGSLSGGSSSSKNAAPRIVASTQSVTAIVLGVATVTLAFL